MLTAGLGTRLRPLSLVRAKAAMPVAGDVLIRRILRWLRRAGITRVVVNLHHKAETITGRLGDGRDLGLEIRYSWEDPVLGSAGGPRRALAVLDAERFLIVNGDTLTDVDLDAVILQHEASDALVTMAVAPGDTTRYGGVMVEDSGIVRGFARAGQPAPSASASASARSESQASYGEIPQKRPDAREGGPVLYHFIGVQAVEARAFADVPDDEPSETVRGLYPRLIAGTPGSIRAHVSPAEFLDIGTPASYFDTVATIAAREGVPLDTGIDCFVAASARVLNSILWDRVRVNGRASIVNCVLADDVVIPEGATYERKAMAMVDGALNVSEL